MKNIVIMALASLAFVACQNEEIATQNSETNINGPRIQLMQVVDEQIVPVDGKTRTVVTDADYVLKFDSQDTYDVTLAQLESMSVEERLAFAKEYGLQSLQEIAVIADEELETIGEEATDEADFREKYEAYKNKYAGILIPNPYDSSDLSLYVPDGDNLSTYLINDKCSIAIGDEITKVQLNHDMAKSDKACFVPQETALAATSSQYNEVWYNNNFSVSNYVKSKKLTFRIEIVDPGAGSIGVHIGAQKHMWYGWKRDDNREFYYSPSLSNALYQVVYNDHLVPVDQAERYCHKGGKLDVVIGKKNDVRNATTGTVLVWSDCIAEKDANGNFQYESKKILNGMKLVSTNVPKCLESKAFHVRVNL